MMIQTYNFLNPDSGSSAGRPQKTLKMVENDRTAGSIPAWETVKTPRHEIEQKLSLAETGHSSEDFQASLAYQNLGQSIPNSNKDMFGFADLIDMINPLQHIPVIGHIYREITGDQIKPISNIIGGALFAGPVGAASGLIDTVAKIETGKDVAGNIVNFIAEENLSDQQGSVNRLQISDDSPEDLPGALLAFIDLRKPDSGIVIESMKSVRGLNT